MCNCDSHWLTERLEKKMTLFNKITVSFQLKLYNLTQHRSFVVKCHMIVTFRGCYSFRNFRLSLFWFLVTCLSKFSKCHLSLSNLCHQCHKFVTSLNWFINYSYIFKLIVLIQSLEALFEGQFKIESCKVGI